MVAFDEWMRLAGPGPPPLRSLSSCQVRKPKPRARAHRCWACRAPGGVCRSAWLRNIGREKTFLPRSRGSSQERTVKPSGRTDEIVDCSRMSDAGEVYVTQTFRSGRLPIVRALFYLYALPMIGRSCSHCPAGNNRVRAAAAGKRPSRNLIEMNETTKNRGNQHGTGQATHTRHTNAPDARHPHLYTTSKRHHPEFHTRVRPSSK